MRRHRPPTPRRRPTSSARGELIESQSLTRPEFDAAKAQFDVSGAQVDAARAQVDSAAAQIRTAEASIASARLNQGDTALAAPFTASVGAAERGNRDDGRTVAGGSYTLADIGRVKAAFGVPDTVVLSS